MDYALSSNALDENEMLRETALQIFIYFQVM